jgi:hypothetical protein
MVELTQHPAQARHPVTNEPLFDDHGAPVPLLPNMRAVRLDGFVIAYASKHGICFTIGHSKLPQTVKDSAVGLVESEFGTNPKVATVPEFEPSPEAVE